MTSGVVTKFHGPGVSGGHRDGRPGGQPLLAYQLRKDVLAGPSTSSHSSPAETSGSGNHLNSYEGGPL